MNAKPIYTAPPAPSGNGSICDTIWMPNKCETLFDFIDAAIATKGQS